MQPCKHAATMATRNLASNFPNGDGALPRGPQALLFFYQKDGGEQSQGPQSQRSRNAYPLRIVQAQFLFAITEEHLTVPTCRDRHGAVPPCSLLDHWKLRSVPGRAEHPTRGVPSHAGSDSVCVHWWLRHAWTRSCRRRASTSAPRPAQSSPPDRRSVFACASLPCRAVSSGTRNQRMLLKPQVMRTSRSRAARHRPVAPYQRSNNTCVCVSATGSNSRMSVSMRSIVLCNATAVSSQTVACRYNTEHPCTKRCPTMRWSEMVAWCVPNPCILRSFGVLLVEASPDHLPGHDAWAEVCAAARVLLPQRLPLRPEMLQPDDHQRLLRPRGLRETSTQPTQPTLPKIPRSVRLLSHFNTPTVRSRRTASAAWRRPSGNAPQRGALLHPDRSSAVASDTSVVSGCFCSLCDTTGCLSCSLFPKSANREVYRMRKSICHSHTKYLMQ